MKPDLMIVANEAEPQPDNEKGEAMEQCVPLSALAMPDEAEQMTDPQPGDEVTYSVKGKVSRVEGPNAYVTVDSVNGEELKQKPETDEPEAGDDAAGLASLEEEARSYGPQ